MTTDDVPRPGLWARLWARPTRSWLMPLGGFVMLAIGAAALGSVNWVVHKTSSTGFCLSCHSHALFIKPEYEASSHYRNEVGVRAGCANCHLDESNWWVTMYTKVTVSKDLVGELLGVISTRAKYEQHRGAMAQKVWGQLLANDSKFCRTCHSFQAMNLSAQPAMSQRMHTRAMTQGRTCIECHRGIVHALPPNADQLWGEVLARAKH